MNLRTKEECGELLKPEAGQRQSAHVVNDGLTLPNLARRGFLGGLAAFAAQCVIDPEFALWVPRRSSRIPVSQSQALMTAVNPFSSRVQLV